jgi:hypothetical protein
MDPKRAKLNPVTIDCLARLSKARQLDFDLGGSLTVALQVHRLPYD